jgi:hypothetical protein
MGFRWREFASLADLLDSIGPNNRFGVGREALLRSGMSRLYYAAFHHARNRAATRGWYKPELNSKDHGALPAVLKKHADSGAKLTGRQLNTMRTFRNVCDYDLPAVFPSSLPGVQIDPETAFQQMKRMYQTVTVNI